VITTARLDESAYVVFGVNSSGVTRRVRGCAAFVGGDAGEERVEVFGGVFPGFGPWIKAGAGLRRNADQVAA
jgi:hypothetical protein